MITNITADELKHTTVNEGLILQGCGGDPREWLDGINGMLAEEGILQNGGEFADIYVFEHDGLTNILFPFDGLEPATLNIGKLAIWRLQTHGTFGGTWLSDYLPNALGVEHNPPTEKESVLAKIREARAAAKTAQGQPTPEKESDAPKKSFEMEV